jgi:hypothetical protein
VIVIVVGSILFVLGTGAVLGVAADVIGSMVDGKMVDGEMIWIVWVRVQ